MKKSEELETVKAVVCLSVILSLLSLKRLPGEKVSPCTFRGWIGVKSRLTNCSNYPQCFSFPPFFSFTSFFQDIDECKDSGGCADNVATCHNNVGSYTCTCPLGYRTNYENRCEGNPEEYFLQSIFIHCRRQSIPHPCVPLKSCNPP